MFFRILRKSLQKRKGKVAISIIAVIMGASIPSAMLTVSLDINGKINYEFRKFGANLLVVPESDTIDVGIGDISLSSVTDQRYINETDINKIKSINWSRNILGYAPFLYQVISAETSEESQQVVLVGTWFDKNTSLEDGTYLKTGVKKINAWWWEIEGNWIDDLETFNVSNDIYCMIGKNVANKMNLQLGNELNISYEANSIVTNKTLIVAGIITSGGTEDNHILVSLPIAQNITNHINQVHTIQVSALCTACPIETIAGEIEGQIDYVDARTILQMTNTEMNILSKIEMMMTLVTIIALLATILGVSTTLTTSVLERRTEIGLMKSIGAENKKIAALFLAESTIIGLIGGIFGFIIGFVGAQIVGLMVFNSLVSLQVIIIPIALGISIGVSLIASFIPVRRAMKIEPIIVLRGE